MSGRSGGPADRARLAILFEDEHLLVVDKPPGVLSVPQPDAKSRDLVALLAAGDRSVIPVHRLDRDVSGCVLLAKDEATRAMMEELFRSHAIEKTYWALAAGRFHEQRGLWSFPILKEGRESRVSPAGQAAETRWRVLAQHGPVTELEIDLITGRYNQIRLHAAHAGHPLVGERKYARGKDDPLGANRLALHSWKLAFVHPHSSARLALEAPLPRALRELRAKGERSARIERPPER